MFLPSCDGRFILSSLERIEAYVKIEQEEKPSERGVPPAYWPADGSLHVENLSARYSPDGPEVLHGISFDVKSGERVGIVGRTGSGKVRKESSVRESTTLNTSRAP
jgi:ABC-type bacteriocin/lantibiotic exporter with double-glycine peptidase domain